jgi:hypothetical protein
MHEMPIRPPPQPVFSIDRVAGPRLPQGYGVLDGSCPQSHKRLCCQLGKGSFAMSILQLPAIPTLRFIAG